MLIRGIANSGAHGTGELLSTVQFMVQTLAAGGALQRELTYDGLRVAFLPEPQTADEAVALG